MYGDPQRLYELAAKVERREDELRARAARLRVQSDSTEWASVAAHRHRARLAADLKEIDRCADSLAEAAAALRSHAAAVARLLALIAEAERDVRTWFRNAQRTLADRAAAVVDAVQDFVADVTPWDGWRWTPTTLPAPGHLDWLDAADLVRGTSWRL